MSKYCYNIENSLSFNYQGLTFCNTLFKNPNYFEYKKGYLDRFLDHRKKVIEKLNNDEVDEYTCPATCMYLKNSDELVKTDSKFKYFEIYHWYQCNCACFYCSNSSTSKLEITKKRVKGVIDVLPALKELKKRDLIDDNAFFSLVGGEPTILKEFPDLLKFVIKNKYSVSILSNGILYEKYIPKALKANENSVLSISIDCSTREKFKQIKKVDKFDEVIKNIKKYIKEAEDAIDRISIKFIILEGVNDSKEEIDNWINLCDSLGVKNLFITIEFCNSYGKKVEIKQETCDLYNYAKSKINENPNFKLSTYDFVEKMVECKSYQV